MLEQGYRPRRVVSRSRRRVGRNLLLQIAFILVASTLGYLALDSGQDAPKAARLGHKPATSMALASAARSTAYPDLLSSGFSLGPAPVAFGKSAPLDAALHRSTASELAMAVPAPALPIIAVAPPAAAPDTSSIAPESPLPASAHAITRGVQTVPLPVPRPEEFRFPTTSDPKTLALRQPSRRVKVAAPTQAVQDNRSFFQKLFGAPPQPAGPALAYAAPEDDVVDRSRGRRLSPTLGPGPDVVSGQATAVYDISARTVYMPNGERLEAHSGLGDKMDDPGFVHVRMKGATPPHVYNLTEREALFHGVRALRLTPVGGSGAIHGRDGLLAHTYLLGPRGDSNGCVSFKDYDRFLQAYLRGEVKRLVVVAGG
jgi:hypothetical protein